MRGALDRTVHAELLRLTIPTIISTLAVPMLGLVDTIVLGRLPDVDQLGAAATANVIFNSVFWVFGFLRMGTTGLVARASGEGDQEGAVRTLFQSLVIGAGIGIALIALQPVIASVGFALIGATERVTELSRAYFSIRIYEAPMFLTLMGVQGYLRGKGDALTPMYLVIGINVVNIAGDLLLVPGTLGLPAMGIRGAAWASLVAQGVGCGAGLWLVARHVRGTWNWSWFGKWREMPWRRFLNVQSDIFWRTLVLVLSLGAVTALAARLHVSHQLAAHAILLQLWSLVSFAVDGFAYATETTVGTWLGRGKLSTAWASGNAAILWGVGAGVAFSIAYLVGIEQIVAVFTRDERVKQVVVDLAWVVAVSQPVNALAYIFDGILIGATDTRYLRNAMILSAAVFGAAVAAGWLLWGLSLELIWGSVVLFMAMRALTLGIRYQSGAWAKGSSSPIERA